VREFKYILNGKIPEACGDILKWSRWFENVDNRRLAQTTLGPYWISTVFLGLDHSWSGAGAPILFESMVFDEEEAFSCERYSTWSEAEKGHARICEIVQRALDRSELVTAETLRTLFSR